MAKTIKNEELIGLTAADAEKLLLSRKAHFRLVPHKGVITADYIAGRINLFLDEEGKVQTVNHG